MRLQAAFISQVLCCSLENACSTGLLVGVLAAHARNLGSACHLGGEAAFTSDQLITFFAFKDSDDGAKSGNIVP
jgi:hypothetical protein